MGTTAGLDISILNLHYPEIISRHYATLIQPEAVLFFCFCLIHEALADGFGGQYDVIHFILNFLLLLLRNRLVVRDIEMRTLDGLLGTCLPHMRAQYLTARSKHNVSGRVMIAQSVAAL
jgi:hypothetical protein